MLSSDFVESKKIYWTEGYKYRLDHDFYIQTDIYPKEDITSSNGLITLLRSGWLIVRRNYSWDGASGLTFDTKSSMRGALTHDAFYELMREKLLDVSWRKQADRELRRICREDGMWVWRADGWYDAVRLAGLDAATVRRTIYSAP